MLSGLCRSLTLLTFPHLHLVSLNHNPLMSLPISPLVVSSPLISSRRVAGVADRREPDVMREERR